MKSDDIARFLQRLDELVPYDKKVDLYIGGGAAVVIAYGGTVATKDVDAIGLSEGMLRFLEEHAGKESDIQVDTGLYLDLVPPGLFLSEFGWRGRARVVDVTQLQRIRVYVMELHDLILSKLKRFNAKDQQDLEWLCLLPELDADVLRRLYRGARQILDHDEKETIDARINRIETQYLGLPSTQF